MTSLRVLVAMAAAVVFALMVGQAHAQSLQPLDQKIALAFSQGAVGKTIGDQELTDTTGKRVRLSQYQGKPLVVNFVYTGCYQVCPATTRFLLKAVRSAQSSLGPEAFNTITIGFNLPFDTPVAMKAFAQRQGADVPGWTFLSPSAATLEQLLRDFGFSYTQTPNGFDHVLQVTVVDAQGRIHRQLYGESFELPLLVQPLKDLLTGTQTPAPTLSDWIERVRLLCTVYDPAAGKYRLNYAVFIEIFVGASIVLAGAGSLVYEWRRSRRSHPSRPSRPSRPTIRG